MDLIFVGVFLAIVIFMYFRNNPLQQRTHVAGRVSGNRWIFCEKTARRRFGRTQIWMIATYTFFRGSQEVFTVCSHFLGWTEEPLTPPLRPMGHAIAAGPNQVASAWASPPSSPFPTQATWPSGRTSTAVGAETAPITGNAQIPS